MLALHTVLMSLSKGSRGLRNKSRASLQPGRYWRDFGGCYEGIFLLPKMVSISPKDFDMVVSRLGMRQLPRDGKGRIS